MKNIFRVSLYTMNEILRLMLCICLGMLPISMGVYAEEKTVSNNVAAIQYDITYTFASTESMAELNVYFLVTNNCSSEKKPVLAVALYDGICMIDVRMSQPVLAVGDIASENISLNIPNSKTDNYYVKAFVWDSTSNLKALGEYKLLSDIDSYLREKVIYVTATENEGFNVFMRESTVKGVNNNIVHTIEYDTAKILPVDLCGFTYEKEVYETAIPNTDIVIESADFENGIIKYRFPNDSGRNTGINNFIKFKSLISTTDAEIKYTIQ